MAIYPTIPTGFWPCHDGTYSDHNRRGACNWHGGIKADGKKVPSHKKKEINQRFAGAVWISISDIHIKKDWFQNRATPYSLRSVENILQAVQEGSFKWVNLDPVTLWQHEGKLYMLSGHSRLEAFTRLCQSGATVEGKDFCSIPAKISKGTSLTEAKKIAQQSNTLNTKETDLERAGYYRAMLIQGKDLKEVDTLANRLEGRNKATVLAYAFLNPAGKTYSALTALENADADSNAIMGKVARWIGNARRKIPQLTDHHENELYDWLITQKGYGTGKGRISAERDFFSRLYSIVNRRMEFGQLLPSLNIQNAMQFSPVEQQYNEQLQRAREEITDLEKQINTKTAELANRGADELQIKKITEGLEASLRRARIQYQSLLQNKSNVAEAAKGERSLFDSLSGFRFRDIKMYI